MSAFLYGRYEAKRERAPRTNRDRSTTTKPPGLKVYADILTGLVPAEVLAAAAVLTAAYTATTKDAQGNDVVTVTDPTHLKWSFYALLIGALALYVVGHLKGGREKTNWDRWDFLRMLIPPLAFAGWAMAQQPASMFDAAIALDGGTKIFLIVIGGAALGVAAGLLGMKADEKTETGSA